MKVAACVVLCIATTAHADSGARFEVGLMSSRVAVTDQTTIAGEMARFGVGFAISRHLHAGAEVEEGWMSGNALSDGTVARTTSLSGPLTGNALDLKVLGGVHTDLRAFRFSGDVGIGLRDTSVSTDLGMDVAGRKQEPLVELRTRVDMFVTHAWTVGVVAGSDMLERRNVTLGAVVSLQLDR